MKHIFCLKIILKPSEVSLLLALAPLNSGLTLGWYSLVMCVHFLHGLVKCLSSAFLNLLDLRIVPRIRLFDSFDLSFLLLFDLGHDAHAAFSVHRLVN